MLADAEADADALADATGSGNEALGAALASTGALDDVMGSADRGERSTGTGGEHAASDTMRAAHDRLTAA